MPWYHSLGWRSNPFDYRPSAEFFAFDDLANEVLQHIESGDVVSTYGIAGMGKTSLLFYLDHVLDRKQYVPVFFDFREVTSVPEFMSILKRRLLPLQGFVGKIQNILRPDSQLLVDEINRMLKGKRLVILIDEVGLLRDEGIASLLATIKDRVNSSIVTTSIEPLSNYDIFKGSFREGRVAREIPFPVPTLKVLRKILGLRIMKVGGQGIFPFSDGALEYLSRLSGNVPRELLINSQNVAMYYVRESMEGEIDKTTVELLLSGTHTVEDGDENLSWIFNKLSVNQKKIIRALMKPKSANELASELGISYGSITKELARLMLQTDVDMMIRKGLKAPVCTRTLSRPYKYTLTKKWRIFLTKE